MSSFILTVAEVKGDSLRQVSLEILNAARQAVASDTVNAVKIASVLIGADVSRFSDELAAYGADIVYVVEHDDLANYTAEAYDIALQEVIKAAQPAAIFFGHTAIGKDLAPLTAAALHAGQISDIIAVHTDDAKGKAVFTRPIYAGKAFEHRAFTSTPAVVTVRPNNIALPLREEGHRAQVETVAYPAPALRTVIREIVSKTSGRVDLSEARVVVSGGRGVKSADGFKPLEELAEVLGGAVGASRGACDAGYCDYALQIGQTGKVVTPELYIACGISGAIQHVAGMSQSRVIIAINKDPDAPIFQIADYGIVGDLFEVVPLLTAQFKQHFQQS